MSDSDVEFLRELADDFGVAAAWGEHAATCKRLREIAAKMQARARVVAWIRNVPIDSPCDHGDDCYCGKEQALRDLTSANP